MWQRLRDWRHNDPHGFGAVLCFVILVIIMLLTGCKLAPPAQKGSSYHAKLPMLQLYDTPAGPTLFPVGDIPELSFKQGENPETGSEQVYERTVDGTKLTERISTSLGTAQRDRARDAWGSIEMVTAKLKAARLPQVLGFVLILAALAMFHPAVRAVTQSSTLQVATGALGLVLIMLSPMFATMSPWVMAIPVGGLAAYYFSWKHGKLQGFVDANNNGIDDRLEHE